MSRLAEHRRLAFDLAVCALLLWTGFDVTTQTGADRGGGADTGVDTLLIPLLVLPVLLRRRAPFAAAAAFAAACVITGIPTFDQLRIPVAIPAGMLIVFAAGRALDRPRAMASLVLVIAGMGFVGATDAVVRDQGGAAAALAFSIPLFGGLWAGGRLVRSRERVADELRARTHELERRREQTARLAVEVERTHLASDLDAAARERMRRIVELAAAHDGAHATDVFARIERMGRESLNEMRGLLGVLRSDERGTTAPRPTLAQLDALLADARSGGRVVDLTVEGERRPLSEGLELAAYRVVQHALVAVRGHEGDAARIRLRYLPEALELQVDGRRAESGSAEAALLAARERVVSQGGDFSHARARPGRLLLNARLPTAPVHA